jgi:hypothetical protein
MTLTLDTSTWGWPQWFMVAIWLLTAILGPFAHGRAKTGHHNYALDLMTVAITGFVLTAGGFFA